MARLGPWATYLRSLEIEIRHYAGEMYDMIISKECVNALKEFRSVFALPNLHFTIALAGFALPFAMEHTLNARIAGYDFDLILQSLRQEFDELRARIKNVVKSEMDKTEESGEFEEAEMNFALYSFRDMKQAVESLLEQLEGAEA